MRERIEKFTQRIYTGSLLPKSYIQSSANHWEFTTQSKPWLQTTHQSSDLEPFKNTLPLAKHHKFMNTLWICTPTIFTPIQKSKWKSLEYTWEWWQIKINLIQNNLIPFLERIQSLKKSLRNWFESVNSNL